MTTIEVIPVEVQAAHWLGLRIGDQPLIGEALLLPGLFSSHSIRRGYCTTATNARVPLSQIRPRSRHRSDEVLGRYIASAEQGWNHSGLEGVGF